MLAFDVSQRCSAAAVQERALELVPVLAGAPLAREARAWVPELLEARGRAIAAGEKPTPEALGLAGVVPGGAAPAVDGSVAIVAPESETLAMRSRWLWAAGAGVIGALVVAGVATVALAVVAGLAFSDASSEAAAAAAPAVEAGAGGEPAVVEPAVVEPAVGVPAVVVPPSAPPGVVAAPLAAPAPGAPRAAPAASVAPARVLNPTVSAVAAPADAMPVRSLSFGANVVGAALIIDGEAQGKTPARGVALGDGGHWIIAKLGDRTCSQHIVVGPDQPSGYVCDLDAEKWTSKI